MRQPRVETVVGPAGIGLPVRETRALRLHAVMARPHGEQLSVYSSTASRTPCVFMVIQRSDGQLDRAEVLDPQRACELGLSLIQASARASGGAA